MAGKGSPNTALSAEAQEAIVRDFIAYLTLSEKDEYCRLQQLEPDIQPVKKKGLFGLASTLMKKFMG
jgi:hypothetical protein